MALHILELSKFKKSVDELPTPLDRWLFFLRHGESLDPDALPEPLNVPDVRWALGDLLMISQSDRERDLYESLVKTCSSCHRPIPDESMICLHADCGHTIAAPPRGVKRPTPPPSRVRLAGGDAFTLPTGRTGAGCMTWFVRLWHGGFGIR
jgi:hypothetical protein